MNVLLGYGFVEFLAEEDADYSIKIMNMIKLYGKPIRVNKASAHQKNLDVGANIFIGNLDPEVDEKLLYDTFSAFGVILTTPKIQRDPETGNSKGFAFINYASFEAADAAIEAMNGQYLCNRYDGGQKIYDVTFFHFHNCFFLLHILFSALVNFLKLRVLFSCYQ